MLRVDNKKVITELAKTTYRANRKRNILTITAIFLTTFLICTVISIGLGYWDAVTLRQQRMHGMDYDIELSEPREDQVSLIREMEPVKYAGLCVKCAVLSQYGQNSLDKIRMFWADEICWEKQIIPALEVCEGEYPKQENEIMLSRGALRDMGIDTPETGMRLALTYQTLAEETKEDEEISEEFVLSGWYLDYTGSSRGYVSEQFYRTTGVKQTDLTQGALKISLKNPLYSEEDIVEMQNQISLEGNQIIEADYDTISNLCKTIAGLTVLLLLVFFSGYLFIYNTLYISVNREIRYYGQLKTLGTTSKQLRSLIYKQICWNSIFGIPLGLLLSGFVGKLVIPLVLRAANPTLPAGAVGASPWQVFVLAAAFAYLTALVSSRKPAKMAEDCSPVEALNYIGTAKRTRSRRSRGGDLISMAVQNLFRDKKQFTVILFSLSLAVSLFMVIQAAVSANNAKNILNQIYDYDMRVLNQTLLSDQEEQVIAETLSREIEKVDGVKSVRVLISATAVVPYQEEVYGEYYRELYESRYSPGNYEKDMELYHRQPDYFLFTCRIVGIDALEFERLNQKLEEPLDQQAFEKGELAFASKSFTSGDNGITGKTVRFSVPSGVQPQEEECIKIGAVIEEFPAYYSAGYSPYIIVSRHYLERLMGDNALVEMLKIDYDKAFSEQTENQIARLLRENRELSAESKLQRYGDMKNTENQVLILGNSVGFIIMLLSLLNFVNMMSAGIQNRAKEFAVLESIGMTGQQIRRMITLESLGYAGLAILLSLLIGLPVSGFVFYSLNRYGIPFSLPIIGNLIVFGFIITVCVLTARLVFNRSEKETIMELLRKD